MRRDLPLPRVGRLRRGGTRHGTGHYAGLRFRMTDPKHLWLPAGLYEPCVTEWIVKVLTEPQWQCRGADVWDIGGHRGIIKGPAYQRHSRGGSALRWRR